MTIGTVNISSSNGSNVSLINGQNGTIGSVNAETTGEDSSLMR